MLHKIVFSAGLLHWILNLQVLILLCPPPLHPYTQYRIQTSIIDLSVPTCVKAEQRCVHSNRSLSHFIFAISTPQPVLKDLLLFVTLLFSFLTTPFTITLFLPPFHSLWLPSGFYCPVLCLTSLIKFPHVIKLHFSKAQQLPKPSWPLFLFLFPPGSVCALQPVGLCCPACLSPDRFMTLLWNLLK